MRYGPYQRSLLLAAGILLAGHLSPRPAVAQGGSAQESAPPGVAFLKLWWAQQPDRPTAIRLINESDRSSAEALYTGGPPLPSTSPSPRRGELPTYVYSAKVRNASGKAIKAASIEYVFDDPETGKEVGRHRFFSFLRIGKKDTVTLNGTSLSPPSATVNARAPGKEGGEPYGERAEFRCVVFADGSVWKNPSAGEPECSELKENWRKYLKTNGGR